VLVSSSQYVTRGVLITKVLLEDWKGMRALDSWIARADNSRKRDS
jgi:hypothetical protein